MSLPIPLRRSGSPTLQDQIYRFIRDHILSGAYRVETQLPSTRELADSLKVSRNTVMLAYEWLTSEGYIETRRGAGTFVCRVIPDAMLSPVTEDRKPPRAEPDLARPALAYPFEAPALSLRGPQRPQFDFAYGRLDPRQFPIRIWRQLASGALAQAERALTEYGEQAGSPSLRQAIGEHLATTRGVVAPPEQIIITAGAQEALNIICRLLVRDGSEVVVEDPTYAAAASIFESYGASLTPIPLDESGIMTDHLAEARASLLYTTPSHQFPTGMVMSLERRRALLAWAEHANAYVVEDDYDSEIIYDRPPIAALAALDQSRRVIYVGSFSKVIGGGLRLGFLVVPPELARPAVAVKSLLSYGQPWLEQATLDAFIRQDSFRSHLRRVRTLYRARRDAVLQAIPACFGNDATLTGQDSGLHVLCTLPDNLPEAGAVAEAAAGVGVGLYTPRRAGARSFSAAPNALRQFVIGYAALTPQEIAGAFGRVSKLLRG
jgi:GntR family transcriptional regulator / MocR family aminotransferase